MKKQFKFLALLIAIMLLAACGNGEASSGEKEYKLRIAHSSAATNDRLENSLQEFKKAIEEKSEGRIVVETYPNSQLGGEREELEGVQNGSIDMAVLSTAPFAGFFEEMMVLDLPYIFSDAEVADKVLDGPFGDQLFESLKEDTGIRGLAWGENGIRHMANNEKPIVTPEDVKGLKIRTQENPAHMDMITAFGGSPTPMAFTELYSAMQQNVIDGYENPFSLIEGMKFYEVTKYLSLTSHVYGVYAFIANDDFLNTLPEDLQELVLEEAKNWSGIERQMNRDQEAKGRDFLAENGMEVNDLTEEQREAFRVLTEPVIKEYRETLGEELVDGLLEAVKEAEGK